MAVTNTPNTLIGDFKNLYEKSDLVKTIPTWALVQDRFEFSAAEATGEYYVFGVVLQRENGFSYAPSSGSSTLVTMNAAIAGYVGQAKVEGYAIYLRSRLDYAAAAKASARGKKAFAQAYAAVLKNMKESHQFRLELSLLYGRDGLGVVDGNSSGVLTITDASWAAGTWAGLKDAVLEAFTGVAASVTQHNGDLTISAVSIADKTVTVTGTSAAVVQNDVLYFKGARTTTGWNECAGLYRILTNTGSLFNIDAASYQLWQANSYAVGGNLSLTAIMQAASIGMIFGLEKGLLMCSPSKFAQLASDEAALRRYIQDQRDAKRGVKGISFLLGSVDVEILPHPLVRDGSAMLLNEKSIQRIGATDITFGMPGSDSKMEVHVTDQTALEMRSMSDQAIFSDMPATCVLMTGIS
jgi:hypothetical protein